MAGLNTIRSTFLEYFADHGHEIVPSGPLVPSNDASLMFANSGMVQFKSLFTGKETRSYTRASTSQKCVRAGGKHNDLENVGYTSRHHTFFEMLGNFSFGDYFKEQAIFYCWDLITRVYGVPADRLLATIYHDDDEAAVLWKKIAGLGDDRIIRISTSDNFWSMGATGPCGPCTELYFDHGDAVQGGPPGSADEDGDRFVEIWNLVFMQFEQHEDGHREHLPRPSIDTGMGLERIGALLQGTNDNYLTDLFQALIMASAQVTGTEPFGTCNLHHRVIADHLRSTSFLIAEGVVPASEGRGYVLRRILRRAIRHVNLLGMSEPAIYRLVSTLVQQMGDAFPELGRAEALITDTIRFEEERFQKTLGRGLRLLGDATANLSEGKSLPGDVAFKLYDTYGFPLDLTQDALRDRGIAVDVAGFEREMQQQRQKSRASWTGTSDVEHDRFWYGVLDRYGPTEFLGYAKERARGQVVAMHDGSTECKRADPGTGVRIVCNQSPFYAEAGGQAGDVGMISTDTCKVRIMSATGFQGLTIHHCRVESGTISTGDDIELAVDSEVRGRTKQNHSATHLLNEALRKTLGSHIVQRGSLNDDKRLRFDFSHAHPLTIEELNTVERTVNSYIRQNSPVQTQLMEIEAARSIGAQALFGEKYDDEVRVVSMGIEKGSGRGVDGNTFSIELCGGTHVDYTGKIGLFVTTGDSPVAAGIRRIEALTGEAAHAYLSLQDQRLAQVAKIMKTGSAEVVERVSTLVEERRQLSQEVRKLKQELARQETRSGRMPSYEQINGIGYFGTVVDSAPANDLPNLVDREKQDMDSGVVVIISRAGGKASAAVGVTDDLTGRVSAVDIIRQMTPLLGGKGGGGRPDLARGGGPDTSRTSEALDKAREYIGGI